MGGRFRNIVFTNADLKLFFECVAIEIATRSDSSCGCQKSLIRRLDYF